MPSTFDTCFSCGRCFNSCECYGKRYIPKVKKEDMKSVVKQKSVEAKQLEFPVLMQSTSDTDLIALFTSETVGTVLRADTEHFLREQFHNWSRCIGSDWDLFEDTIELSN